MRMSYPKSLMQFRKYVAWILKQLEFPEHIVGDVADIGYEGGEAFDFIWDVWSDLDALLIDVPEKMRKDVWENEGAEIVDGVVANLALLANTIHKKDVVNAKWAQVASRAAIEGKKIPPRPDDKIPSADVVIKKIASGVKSLFPGKRPKYASNEDGAQVCTEFVIDARKSKVNNIQKKLVSAVQLALDDIKDVEFDRIEDPGPFEFEVRGETSENDYDIKYEYYVYCGFSNGQCTVNVTRDRK
jgi:hypothetical protein